MNDGLTIGLLAEVDVGQHGDKKPSYELSAIVFVIHSLTDCMRAKETQLNSTKENQQKQNLIHIILHVGLFLAY